MKGTKPVKPVLTIVGASRSGTTLMRNIINATSEWGIANENYFLGHLIRSQGMRRVMRLAGDPIIDEEVKAIVKFWYTGRYRQHTLQHNTAYWEWLVEAVASDEVERRIVSSDRTDRSIFYVLMDLYADWAGKSRAGEKTPTHIRYLDEWFDWFPAGRVIHMIRDPRAVFVSDLARRRRQDLSRLPTPYAVARKWDPALRLLALTVTIRAWKAVAAAEEKYRGDDRYLAVRFEDLINDPSTEIKRVCEFVESKFAPELLEQTVVQRGFSEGSVGFDRAAASRWEEEISHWERALLSWRFRSPLRKLGYTT